MPNQDKLRNLEKKKKELIRNIESCESNKYRVIKLVKELNKQHKNEIISYRKYCEELNKTLKNRTPQEWTNYYNDYIKYYRYEIDNCNREIRKESISVIIPMIAVLSIFILLGIGLWFLQPTITGMVIGEEIPEEIQEEPIIKELPVSLEPEELIQGTAEINKPVKWTKIIRLNESTNNLKVRLPEDISNVKFSKLVDGVKEEIAIENLKTRDKEEISILEKTKESEIIIEDSVKDVEIEYETEAPSITEKDVNEYKKEITISSEVHYENILAYTTINEAKKDLIKLYRTTDGIRESTEITKYTDTTNNQLIDYIEWIVPSLSNETYEIEITILNVQSYPTVGGNWTVEFTTSGKANLTITAVDGTTWSNVNEDNDLKFLEVKCGDSIKEYEWIDNSVLINDYECSETAYEISKVITTGKHTLEFDFGGVKAYAYNQAEDYRWTTPGIVAYGNASANYYVQARYWNMTDFSNPPVSLTNLGTGAANTERWIVVKSAIARNQTALGKMNNTGDLVLSVMLEDSTWTTPIHVSTIGTTNDNFRAFDIGFEELSGDFLVVYDKNNTANREFNYRTWNGAVWTNEEMVSLNSDAASEAQLVFVAERKHNSDEIMVATTGASDDITALRWDGTNFTHIDTITTNAAQIDYERFDIAWESLSGDAVLAWGAGAVTGAATGEVNYTIWNSATNTWNGQTTLATVCADCYVYKLDLCSDPTSDYIGTIFSDNSSDLNVRIWNGDQWLDGQPVEETSIEVIANHHDRCEWTTNDGTALFTYADANALTFRYFLYNRTTGIFSCTENGQNITSFDNAEGSNGPCITVANIMSDDIETLKLTADPNSNDIMILGMDLAEDLEMFIFNGSYVVQPTMALLDAILTTKDTTDPADFDYFRFVPALPNNAPTTPDLNLPENNTQIADVFTVELNWSNSSDIDNNALTYYLEIWNETGMTNLMYVNSSITETDNTTEDLVTFPSETEDYFWRVLATDGTDNSSWSELRNISFSVSAPANTAPSDPTGVMINSTSANQLNYTDEDLSANFLCSDPDDADTLTYDIYWYNEGIYNFSEIAISCGSEPAYISHILKNENTTKGESWSFSVNVTDIGSLSSNTIFSNNLTIINSLPVIPFVSLNETITPFEGGIRQFEFSFIVNDTDGTTDLTDNTAKVNISLGTEGYINNTCSAIGNLALGRNYSCTIEMQYYWNSGSWNYATEIKDNDGIAVQNSTGIDGQSWYYSELIGLNISSSSLAWATLIPNTENQTSSSNPITIENTGNKATLNIRASAIDLAGTGGRYIPASNFTIGNITSANKIECDYLNKTATATPGVAPLTFINATNIYPITNTLSRGQGSKENLYYCLFHVPANLISEIYSTGTGTEWSIDVE